MEWERWTRGKREGGGRKGGKEEEGRKGGKEEGRGR